MTRDELMKLHTEAAQAATALQALVTERTVIENATRTDDEPYGLVPKTMRLAIKDARLARSQAVNAFQTAVESAVKQGDILVEGELKSLYAQIAEDNS